MDLLILVTMRDIVDDAAKYGMASYPDQSLIRLKDAIDRRIMLEQIQPIVDETIYGPGEIR